MFIRIVEISSLACIGQSLFTFWSHTEQSWMFALIVADSLYYFASLVYDKFKRNYSLSYA